MMARRCCVSPLLLAQSGTRGCGSIPAPGIARVALNSNARAARGVSLTATLALLMETEDM